MKWPWQTTEKRAASLTYRDAIIALTQERAEAAASAQSGATAALEMCAGTVGRGFASAEVTGRAIVANALTPDCLQIIGRSMVRNGGSCWYINIGDMGIRLMPAHEYDVTGGPDPLTWEYRLTLAGPTSTEIMNHVPADMVCHFRYASDPYQPWLGLSALDVAYLSGKLSAELVQALGYEAGGSVARLMPVANDADSPANEKLRANIKAAKGRVALFTAGDLDNVGSGVKVDGQSHRLGAEPPASLVALYEAASREVMACNGFNPALFTAGDAASLRESWRLGLFGVISPLGKLVEAEIRGKMDPSIKLQWGELRASDLQTRSRAVKQLADAGIPTEAALTVAGIDLPEGTVIEEREPMQPPGQPPGQRP